MRMDKYSIDQVEVGTNDFQVGRDEDGMPTWGRSHFAVAVALDGRRWEHELRLQGIPGGMMSCHEAAARIQGLVERIERNLAQGGELDLSRWREVEPVYGSEAYIRQGCEFDQLEREFLAG